MWFAHRLVRDVCGSNLNQSRVYKISPESLLHRVQSCGQSEFTSYRSHCPLYLFRLLIPINNQTVRTLCSLRADTFNPAAGCFTWGLTTYSSIIYRATFKLQCQFSCRNLSFSMYSLIFSNKSFISHGKILWYMARLMHLNQARRQYIFKWQSTWHKTISSICVASVYKHKHIWSLDEKITFTSCFFLFLI